MSYVRQVGDMTVFVECASNPEGTYNTYYNNIEQKILADGYEPKTTMDNLIVMIILSFDSDDNYGEYDEETGCGGYGEKFTLEECYVISKNQAGMLSLITTVKYAKI